MRLLNSTPFPTGEWLYTVWKRQQELFTNILLLLAIISLIPFWAVASTDYFKEVDRVSHTRLIGETDMSIYSDYASLLVTTGVENSSIQLYGLKFDTEPSFEPEPIVFNHKPPILKLFSDLMSFDFYTISEEYRNKSHGCLLSGWHGIGNDIDLQSELFIKVPFRNKEKSFQGSLTSNGRLLFLTCQNVLAAVNIDSLRYDLIFKDSITINDNFTPSDLIYVEFTRAVYTSYSLMSVSDETQAVAQVNKVSISDTLEAGDTLLDNTNGYFYTKEILIPSKTLWIYTYSEELFGSFLTVELDLDKNEP